MTQSPFGKGFKPHHEKIIAVNRIFSGVANAYDLMNDLMSVGLHRAWKYSFVKTVTRANPGIILDMAAGTGDISGRLHQALPAAEIVAMDINPDMLNRGRDAHIDKGRVTRIMHAVASAEAIPLADAAVDAYVISFGLRNVGCVDKALAEAQRVLKLGGSFYCLEFSPATSPLLKRGYDFYAQYVIPTLGEIVTGNRAAYQYLVDSIETFCLPHELSAKMRQAGFTGVYNIPFMGGIVQCHVGYVEKGRT
ncbi:MAG: ubiquinone/menaquinone biosynthesis methyltransferase [Alphaproteobacteria bacterium]|nr:MAG: ubiquinone/menaquinone biosynthesis methyltransferase [Alphaproteobacteria bacterium]